LARTGVDVLAGTWMSAFALMLAGLVLVAIRRRRSAE
jgi:LPXTG-motif cell wall-anchored protein